MLLSQLVNQYGTPQSLQVIQQNVQPAVQQFFHPQQLVQQVVQGQTMMLQQPMMQQIPVMQQPTIIQTGITQNGQPIYMMSQNRQAQVMQPMVPIPQPGGGVLQYLGTFPTSALPTLSDYMTAGSLGVSQNQPSQQAITTYILQADGTLIQVQPQPAFQNLAPQQNIIYNQPQIQTIYQPQAPLPSASQGQTSVAMSPSVSQPQSFTMSNSFSNPMADVSATCSTPYQQSIPCSSQYQQSVAYQAQPAPTSTPYAALGTTSYQHSMPVLSSTPNSQAVIRPRFPQPYEVPRPKMSQSRPEVHKRPMPTAANYHRSQQFTHIAGKQGARTPFPQNPQFDNFQDNGAQSPFPYKQDSIHTHQFPVCDKASTSHLTKQASACPSPDLLQRALVESSTFSDAFDDFFSEEPQGIQHASFHASVQMENTLPPLKDYFEEISDTRELSAPEPIKTPVESLTNSPSSRQATPPVLPSPSPCDNLVSSSCPDTADTPTPAVSQPSTPSTSQIPTPEPHHSNIKAPRPSFSYRDFAAKAKTEVQDSKVSPGKSNDKPSYKVVVQRTEKQGYEVSAADSSTGDKPLETLKEEKKATKEKTPTPTESRTKSFQVKAKLVVPAGSSAKMFTDADKKLVAPIVENFAKRLAQVPTFDTSAVEKTQAAPPPKGPHIVYEVTSADGFFCRSHDINEVWQQVLFAVQEARRAHNIPPIPENEKKNKNGMQLLGLSHNALQYLVEQLPGAKKCTDHNFKYHHPEKEESLVESKHGCARAQAYSNRNPHDMFGWLASQHRPKPSAPPQCLVEEAQATITRRVTATQSSDLPMSMRYRQLRKTAKDTVGVFRSPIHGRGLFCKRDVEPGEMVIEYAGEVIRSSVTDVREKLYEAKGIGCYMFRIDDEIVVDATMHGNAARFINHSCDPNCFSKIVDVYGKKHIIIFALRKIYRGEELTYNYKFPIEDDKIPCSCQAKRCRKYLN